MASDPIPPAWTLEFLRPGRRFDPTQTLRIVEYQIDEVKKGLAGGHFLPVVRHAQMLAETIRLAAIAEESSADLYAHSVSHRFRTTEPGA